MFPKRENLSIIVFVLVFLRKHVCFFTNNEHPAKLVHRMMSKSDENSQVCDLLSW